MRCPLIDCIRGYFQSTNGQERLSIKKPPETGSFSDGRNKGEIRGQPAAGQLLQPPSAPPEQAGAAGLLSLSLPPSCLPQEL